MANLTTAKVTITAHKVGPELKRYIDVSAQHTYDILTEWGSGYSLEKDGETWTFKGYGTGRWNYGSNVQGYFGGGAGWFGPDSDSEVSYRELAEAIASTRGSVAIEWADYDPGEWVGRGEAHLGTDEAGNLSFSGVDLTETRSYDLANLMTAFDLTLQEAVVEHAGDECAELFWKFWQSADQPTPEEANRWLRAIMELEYGDQDELSEDAGVILIFRLLSEFVQQRNANVPAAESSSVLVTVPAGTSCNVPDEQNATVNPERRGD